MFCFFTSVRKYYLIIRSFFITLVNSLSHCWHNDALVNLFIYSATGALRGDGEDLVFVLTFMRLLLFLLFPLLQLKRIDKYCIRRGKCRRCFSLSR